MTSALSSSPSRLVVALLCFLAFISPSLCSNTIYLTTSSSGALIDTLNPCSSSCPFTSPCQIPTSQMSDSSNSPCAFVIIGGAYTGVALNITSVNSVNITTISGSVDIQVDLSAPIVSISSDLNAHFARLTGNVVGPQILLQNVYVEVSQLNVNTTKLLVSNSSIGVSVSNSSIRSNPIFVLTPSTANTVLSISSSKITSATPILDAADLVPPGRGSVNISISSSTLVVPVIADLSAQLNDILMIASSQITVSSMIRVATALSTLSITSSVLNATSTFAHGFFAEVMSTTDPHFYIHTLNLGDSVFERFYVKSLSIGDANFNGTAFVSCIGGHTVNHTLTAYGTRFITTDGEMQNSTLVTGTATVYASGWSIEAPSDAFGVDVPLALTGGSFSPSSSLVVHGLGFNQSVVGEDLAFDGSLTVMHTLQPQSAAWSSATLSTLRTSSSSASWTIPSISNPPVSKTLNFSMTAGVLTYNHTADTGIARQDGGPTWTFPTTVGMLWNAPLEPIINQTGIITTSAAFADGRNIATGVAEIGSDFTAQFEVHPSITGTGTDIWYLITSVACPACLSDRSYCYERRNCTCKDHWTGLNCNDFIAQQGTCSGPPPAPQFTCIDGVWNGISLGPVTTIDLPREQPIIIQGNLTVTNSLIFNGPSNSLNVSGCITIGPGGIVVTFTKEDLLLFSTAKGISISQNSTCEGSLQSIAVSVTTPPKTCSQVTPTKSGTQSGLSIIFTVDRRNCNNTGTIVGATFGAIIITVIIAASVYAVWRWKWKDRVEKKKVASD